MSRKKYRRVDFLLDAINRAAGLWQCCNFSEPVRILQLKKVKLKKPQLGQHLCDCRR